MTLARTVLVRPERVVRWFDNFEARHGAADFIVQQGCLLAAADDGSVAVAALPFGRGYDGAPDRHTFADAALAPVHWGILLVRKGGFAVACLQGSDSVGSKVGQRHVQGRTKAGGQSQQRFARRRDNQARQAYEAAAGHAHRVLVLETTDRIEALVCGGDRSAVDAVLADPRLEQLTVVRTDPWLDVPDPRRRVLDQAAIDGRSARITVTDPE